MNTQDLKIVFKPNSSNDFTTVNHLNVLQPEISMNCNTKLFPGEFPFCGNCIHYSGPRVCPVAGVSVDHTSDGTGCVMIGVYQKKTCTKDSVMCF